LAIYYSQQGWVLGHIIPQKFLHNNNTPEEFWVRKWRRKKFVKVFCVLEVLFPWDFLCIAPNPLPFLGLPSW
jgi:hypothetical protein